LVSARRLGRRGRRFESDQPDQYPHLPAGSDVRLNFQRYDRTGTLGRSGSLAQLAAQRALNPQVLGSNPRRPTTQLLRKRLASHAGVAESADARVLGARGSNPVEVQVLSPARFQSWRTLAGSPQDTSRGLAPGEQPHPRQKHVDPPAKQTPVRQGCRTHPHTGQTQHVTPQGTTLTRPTRSLELHANGRRSVDSYRTRREPRPNTRPTLRGCLHPPPARHAAWDPPSHDPPKTGPARKQTPVGRQLSDPLECHPDRPRPTPPSAPR
jgi:hypothetical protein